MTTSTPLSHLDTKKNIAPPDFLYKRRFGLSSVLSELLYSKKPFNMIAKCVCALFCLVGLAQPLWIFGLIGLVILWYNGRGYHKITHFEEQFSGLMQKLGVPDGEAFMDGTSGYYIDKEGRRILLSDNAWVRVYDFGDILRWSFSSATVTLELDDFEYPVHKMHFPSFLDAEKFFARLGLLLNGN